MRKEGGFDRRSVLKSIGTGGMALACLPTVTSATGLSEDKIDQVIDTPPVEALRNAVGGFKVNDIVKRRVEKVQAVTGFEINTNLGQVLYLVPEEGESMAQLQFTSLKEKPRLRKRLPVEYRTVPLDTEIVLKANPEITLVRSITSEEVEKISNIIKKDSGTIEGVYHSGDKQYLVTTSETNSQNKESAQFIVGAQSQGKTFPINEVKQINKSPTVSLQGGCASPSCVSCVTWGASRVGCYMSCAMGNVPGCLYCLGVNTVATFGAMPACDTCADLCL